LTPDIHDLLIYGDPMLLEHQPDLTVTDSSQPIRRIGIPRIDAVSSDLFNVRVTLAATPSTEWREAFVQFEDGVVRSNLMVENPSLVGNAISLCGVRETDVEFWFKLIDTKIAGVNIQESDRTPATLTAVREREAAGARSQQEAQARADRIARRWEAPDV
jgi:hypothetical protein